jgi:hypothetical protein
MPLDAALAQSGPTGERSTTPGLTRNHEVETWRGLMIKYHDIGIGDARCMSASNARSSAANEKGRRAVQSGASAKVNAHQPT